MDDFQKISLIYDEDYANQYDGLYLYPWMNKHELNIKNIERILLQTPCKNKKWLDTFCGQAWHFSRFPKTITKIGVDISSAQLELAKIRNPDATFIQGNILDIAFPDSSFNIITNFWAAYCYLDSFEKIESLFKNLVQWLQGDGSLYFEILTAEALKLFNSSAYSQRTGFSVNPRTPDFIRWSYEDSGGTHNMTSPPIDFFIELISKSFSHVEAIHDQGFMTHLIALGKK